MAPARGMLGLALLASGLGLGCGQSESESEPNLGGIGPSARAVCDLYAAPGGSDSATGTRSRPFRTAQRLVDGLNSGQTGCFRGGTFTFDLLELTTRDVTITSHRDEAVTLEGEIKVLPAGAGSTIEGLKLNGASSIGPRIYADEVTLRGNEITNDHTSICVSVSRWYSAPPPQGVTIERNRIHDCGELPATNKQHGVYISEARDTVIRDNWIYANADRGIQLYPDADGSTITGNVIDSNGEGIVFAGEGPSVSSDNLVTGNVISNSMLGWNVYANTPGISADGNLLRHNCIWAGDATADFESDGGVETSSDFRSTENAVMDPRYTDPDAHDYTLSAQSECPLASRPGFPALNGQP
jgi:parallel beta-helix repeat protein